MTKRCLSRTIFGALLSAPFLLHPFQSKGQSELLIPSEAVAVFSINNFQLLQKISLDELIQYEFMNEIHQEIFDGSTNGRTIKDSGIDFKQKLNVFFGQNERFELAGFTFGINDQKALFEVFDDFDKQTDESEFVQHYRSYFNHLLIKGQAGLLIRVDPNESWVRKHTDSIWFSRGHDRIPGETDWDEAEEEILGEDADWSEDMDNEMFAIDDELSALEDGDESLILLSEEDLLQENYNDLKDSVFLAFQERYFQEVMVHLFLENKNLSGADPELAALLTHGSEAVFFMDNSRNVVNSSNFSQFRTLFPTLHRDLKELYKGNKVLGDLYLKDDQIEAKITTTYGDALGRIYAKMNNTKFDGKVTRYIHDESPMYFNYNVNLQEAYDQAYQLIIPLLKEQKNTRIATNVLVVEVLNEFLNKEAIFDTYKGSMFASYSGVKTVQVTQLEYTYDEDFNYEEKEVLMDQEIPIFTLGFSTERNDIPEMVLRQLAKMTSKCKKVKDYWVFEEAILNSLPIYIINQNDLFILTNDERLIVNTKGFGKNRLGRKKRKAIKKSGFLYAKSDWNAVMEGIPETMLSDKNREVFKVLKTQGGVMELKSSSTTTRKTDFTLTYTYEGKYENSGKYVLDVVNSLFVILK